MIRVTRTRSKAPRGASRTRVARQRKGKPPEAAEPSARQRFSCEDAPVDIQVDFPCVGLCGKPGPELTWYIVVTTILLHLLSNFVDRISLIVKNRVVNIPKMRLLLGPLGAWAPRLLSGIVGLVGGEKGGGLSAGLTGQKHGLKATNDTWQMQHKNKRRRRRNVPPELQPPG